MKSIIGILLLSIGITCQAIEITTENSEKAELETVELLKALRKSHDISKWEFTDIVHINRKTIPHSHPILTLHTKHTSREEKDILLSTYIHEQIHWHLNNNENKTRAAINELKSIFKNAPVGYPEGAIDENSTYEHLIVCYLELEAIAELLSESRVNHVSKFWQDDHYTWVYKQVEKEKEALKKIIDKYGLKIV
ncbi:MAG: hypothetical protein HRT38_19830 [Alteromonadaceae bacterium]|nr:hypothetical protein [Alteromonadaceae bacterium]